MNAEAPFQLNDLAGVVRRRAGLMGGVTLVTLLAFYWIAMALPNEYESYATVLVEPQSVAADLVKAGVRASDLNERLQLMAAEILSRPRLSRLIDDQKLYREESEYLLREEVIDLMRDHLRVEPVLPEMEAGSQRTMVRPDYVINQFRIYFRNKDARVARNVAQALADDFIEEHIDARVKVSQKSLEFVDSERQRVSERIADVEKQIQQVKETNAGKLPEDIPNNQQQLARLNAEVTDARRRLGVARSDETFFRNQSLNARQLSASGDDANPERRMQMLELALRDYAARGYTDKHPDVIKARQEVGEVRALLDERRKRSQAADDSEPATFAQQNAEAEAHRAELRRASEELEIQELDQAIARVEARLAETPSVAEQLGALEREYRHLFMSYQDVSEKRQNAAVQADLERRQFGEQFRVLEAAFDAPEPVSPNRPLIVALGAIFALVLGAAVGVLIEAIDPAVHDTRQLQELLHIPVLAAIPKISLEIERVQMRRRRIRTAFATAGLVAFALVGGAANYVWVNGSPFARPAEEGGAIAGQANVAPVSTGAKERAPAAPSATEPAAAPVQKAGDQP